jgi:hypothetical protein
VLPLLQATDKTLFVPFGDKNLHAHPLLVGINRKSANGGFMRPCVAAALKSKTDIDIIGPSWTGFVQAEWIKGDFLPNNELSSHYRGSPIVLADHMPKMADHKIAQNRLFDAVASGARVVSDRVDEEAVEELFSGAVQSFSSDEEFSYLCSDSGRHLFPSDSEMQTIAQRVRDAHSFDNRAKELIGHVQAYRRNARQASQRVT